MAVAVFGSINMDLVARTPRLPAPAESIIGYEFFTAPGGKGANQAVALARLGVPTKMVGRVGADSFGHELRQHLEDTGVDISSIFVDTEEASGVAIITVDDSAQNSIIVVLGANGRVDQSDVDRLEAHLAGVSVLLTQLEVPLQATVAAARLARQRRITVVLDPAPAQDVPDELYGLVDIITPNEVEAAQLAGFSVKNQEDAARAARVFLDKGVKTAIVKLGAIGAFYSTHTGHNIESEFVPAFKVTAVDSVAAGDAFNGGLAAALVEGHSLPLAVRWGAAVAALSTTKAGAQPSMPDRLEFEDFWAEQSERAGGV